MTFIAKWVDFPYSLEEKVGAKRSDEVIWCSRSHKSVYTRTPHPRRYASCFAKTNTPRPLPMGEVSCVEL